MSVNASNHKLVFVPIVRSCWISSVSVGHTNYFVCVCGMVMLRGGNYYSKSTFIVTVIKQDTSTLWNINMFLQNCLRVSEYKHKHISQVSKKIQSGACAFTMDLYCCVTHLQAIMAGKLACISRHA